jgi:hypothetical protein
MEPSPGNVVAPAAPAAPGARVSPLAARAAAAAPAAPSSVPTTTSAGHALTTVDVARDKYDWRAWTLPSGDVVDVAARKGVPSSDVDAILSDIADADRAIGDALARPRDLLIEVTQNDKPAFHFPRKLVMSLDTRGCPRAATVQHEYGHALFDATLEALQTPLGTAVRNCNRQQALPELKRIANHFAGVGDAAMSQAYQQVYDDADERYDADAAAAPPIEFALSIVFAMFPHTELFGDLVAALSAQNLSPLGAGSRSFDRAAFSAPGFELTTSYSHFNDLRLALGDELKRIFALPNDGERLAEGQRLLRCVFEAFAADGNATLTAAFAPGGNGDMPVIDKKTHNDRLIADVAQRFAASTGS